MNNVINNLLNRQNKSVPIKDGRKIVLVNFGGMMLGIRGAAAMIALDELQLHNAFDEIYTISAGFANASYFLSNQAAFGTSIYWEDLSGRKFINYYKLWNIANINYAVKVIATTKKLDIHKLLQSKTKLYVRLVNIKQKEMVYLEVHDVPKNEYLGLMKAAISVPYLHPGSPTIGEIKYKDPGFRKNDLIEHLEKVFASNPTDIVIIYNHYGQYLQIKRKWATMPKNVLEIIPKPEWKMNRFETNTAVLQSEASRMGRYVKELFKVTDGISLAYDRN